jgi:hypothetical protein
MLIALLLSTVLFAGAIGSHLTFLRTAHRMVGGDPSLLNKLGASLIVFLSHLLIAGWFAIGFWVGAKWGLGGFDNIDGMGWMDYYDFSLVNVTTLGLGAIYPTQHLRVIAGIEALTGFLLISCSAQLFWSMMKKGDNS